MFLFLACYLFLTIVDSKFADDGTGAITLNDCPSTLPRDRFLRVHGSSCYQFILSHEREFPDAERECESRRGRLVIIRNAEVQSYLYTTLKNEFQYNGPVWIGLTDKQSEGHWVWTDGTPLGYSYWASGQPGLFGSLEDCAAMEMDAGGHWGDYRCEGVLFVTSDHYFVCEYPVTIVTTTTALPTTTTTEAPLPRCAQCGDLDRTVPCTEQELNSSLWTPCPGVTTYCMTDVYREDGDAPVQYYKRCVDELTCHQEFYLQYEQSDFCLHLDQSMPDILVCHICCQGNGCNQNTTPPASTIYKPAVNGTRATATEIE